MGKISLYLTIAISLILIQGFLSTEGVEEKIELQINQEQSEQLSVPEEALTQYGTKFCNYYFQGRCFRRVTGISGVPVGTKFLIRQEYIVTPNTNTYRYSQLAIEKPVNIGGQGVPAMPDGLVIGSVIPKPINPNVNMIIVYKLDTATNRGGWFWEHNNKPVYFDAAATCAHHLNDLQFIKILYTPYFAMRIQNYCNTFYSRPLFVLNANTYGYRTANVYLPPQAYWFTLFVEV